ncbi:MAG: cupin domain-containing protein [Myxococcota bacterium]
MPRKKMVIFEGANAPTLQDAAMSTGRSHVGGAPIDAFFSDAITTSFKSSVPYRQQDQEGMSLVHLDFPPGAMLPRHSHSADCLYYIISGGIFLGQRELNAGDGFYVPAEQPYAYRAGTEGVVLLEFRQSTAFDTKFHEKDPERFRAKAEASLANPSRHDSAPSSEATAKAEVSP